MIKENLIPLFQVDAFTEKPFAGNPAAVCLLQHEAEFDWMRAVGAEMNLSETGFVRRRENGFERAYPLVGGG
jgi:PhzF family phenazine biosynthesis protein